MIEAAVLERSSTNGNEESGGILITYSYTCEGGWYWYRLLGEEFAHQGLFLPRGTVAVAVEHCNKNGGKDKSAKTHGGNGHSKDFIVFLPHEF